MPDTIVYILLLLALVLPVPGAILLRLLAGRLGERGVLVGATILFVLAIAGALTLAQANVGLLRVGDLTLLLPGTRGNDDFSLPPDVVVLDEPLDTLPTAAPLPSLTPRPSATVAPTATRRPSATPAPSATPEPTATLTPEPPTATPEPPPAAGPRRYIVQPGDTLRSIAEQFEVTVAALLEANNLTPAQADGLRSGQELIIP